MAPPSCNLPAHTALPIQGFLAKYSIPVLPQPLYSPGLSSPDFFFYPRNKKITLKGRRFQTAEDIIMNMTDDHRVSQQTFLKQWFQLWKR
jgi:hypothetical protein